MSWPSDPTRCRGGASLDHRGHAPRHPRFDEEADIADLAAAYLVGFARSQGFNDGNKRTTLASALVFLSLNGYALHGPPAELYALTMRVATNDAGDEVASAYLRGRIEEAG